MANHASLLPALLTGISLLVGAGSTEASPSEQMMHKCRVHAANELRTQPQSVDVKYEGQRTDKTHAVNGSAVVDGDTRTFQCSFASDGIHIAKFIVNAAPKHSGGGDSSNHAERAGMGKFDATGMVPCAQNKGQPMGQCKFGVARGGGGSATVVVSKPDGRTRAIFFEKGQPLSADSSQADGYGEFRSRKEVDLFFIQVGNERYEITEAVIFGG